MTTCTKNVNAPCENEATEILWVRSWGSGEARWEEHPRCAEHPAADDAVMIRRVSPPLAEIRIVPVGAQAQAPGEEAT
jgi:hypothetical protein